MQRSLTVVEEMQLNTRRKKLLEDMEVLRITQKRLCQEVLKEGGKISTAEMCQFCKGKRLHQKFLPVLDICEKFIANQYAELKKG